MKEQIQKYARKHIEAGCYLKVTLGHRGLTLLAFKIIAILHNALLATFIKLLETVSKSACRRQIRGVRWTYFCFPA
jgi:hypothetical protein